MSRLDSLPPDLHAVLSLLLRQHKRHAEVAAMLGIEARAVHDRAHAALALLAPRQARALSASERERLGEYLLGQQDPAAQRDTRGLLEDSAGGRAWAHALAAELAPLAAQPLPHIPAGHTGAPAQAQSASAATTSTPSHVPPDALPPAQEPPGPSLSPAPTSQAPSSRVGGAAILGALAVIVVVVVVLLVVGVGGGGRGGGPHSSSSASDTTSQDTTGISGTSTGTSTSTGTGATAGTDTTTGTGTTAGAGTTTSHSKALALTPPDPATSKAVGVAYVLTQKGQRAFYVFAKGLPRPPTGSFYAVWLEGSSTAAPYPLGSLPAQGANGLVEGGGPLPTNAGSYTRVIVTTETSDHPAHPGPTALHGAFTVG